MLWATRVEYIKGFCVKELTITLEFSTSCGPLITLRGTSGDFLSRSPFSILRSVGIREWRVEFVLCDDARNIE